MSVRHSSRRRRSIPCLRIGLCIALAAAFLIPTTRFPNTRALGGDDDLGRKNDRDEVAATLGSLVELLGQSDEADFQLDLLAGMSAALEGRRDVAAPAGWSAVSNRLAKSPRAEVRERSLELSLIFHDPSAIRELKRTASDNKAEGELRRRALRLLVEHRADGMTDVLRGLLRDETMRREALAGLASYPSGDTPALILAEYAKLNADERLAALDTLSSRRDFALALLDAIEEKQVPRGDVTTVVARQLSRLNDDDVNTRLREVWGEIRQSSTEKKKLIAEFQSRLTAERIAAADTAQGKLVFDKTCRQCHTLYGEGGKIGPDITGSDRANLTYVLENVLDPSAAVPRAYRLTTVITDEGRVISGLVERMPNGVFAVQTATERVLVPESNVDELRESSVSMMPEGLFDNLTPDQIRDLVAFLAVKK